MGSHDSGSDREAARCHTETYDSKEDVPSEMWELKPSRISGQEVYIGRSDDGDVACCF